MGEWTYICLSFVAIVFDYSLANKDCRKVDRRNQETPGHLTARTSVEAGPC